MSALRRHACQVVGEPPLPPREVVEVLSASGLRAAPGDLADVAIWLCGPDRFARALTADLGAIGFDVRHAARREEFRSR